MLFRLLILFIVVPIIELVLLLQLADKTHWWVALGVVVATGVVGTLLARAQGFLTLQRIRRELAGGSLPTAALLDAALIFVAGALLLTPGLLTDALGLSLLIPWTRSWIRHQVWSWIRRHFQVFTPGSSHNRDQQSRIIDSYVVESPPPDEASHQEPE